MVFMTSLPLMTDRLDSPSDHAEGFKRVMILASIHLKMEILEVTK